MKSNSENLEHRRGTFELKEKDVRLQKENDRLDCLLDYYSEERSGVIAVGEQRNRVLMHYNELQSRSAEVEAMAMNFEQRVAGAVAKAELRAKPGPKKEVGIKGTTNRGKASEPQRVDFWRNFRRKPNFRNGAAAEAQERRE
jgi:hypothetical protein